MRLYCIASGSSGNCIYVEACGQGIMIDAGVSAKRIMEGLRIGGFPLPQAIFITHEHSDHILGLEVLLKHSPIPLYSTEGTLISTANTFKGSVPEDLFNYIMPECPVFIGDIKITPYKTSHDASDSVFYVIEAEGKKLCIATDMGEYDEATLKAMSGADVLYLESNYDTNMLMVGKYPYSLKQRIAGARGHLSNDMAAEFAVKLLHPGLKLIMLAHLSKENNYAELAFETMRQSVEAATENAPMIMVANRDIPTDIINF